ncbi:MAG: ATP synthase F0 subunit B [Acidobacteria bacterium]|nr:ATP synthase F0 subunit B [Acidobacteriota bacterium]
MLTLALAGIQLFPDGTLFIHIALILVMIWALNRTFFKPINEVIAKRSRQKAGRGGEADDILRDVEEKKKQYEKRMLEARTRSYEMIEREREAAVAARQALIDKAKAETSAYLSQELADLEKERAEAKVTVALDAHKMAEKITRAVLKG